MRLEPSKFPLPSMIDTINSTAVVCHVTRTNPLQTSCMRIATFCDVVLIWQPLHASLATAADSSDSVAYYTMQCGWLLIAAVASLWINNKNEVS